MNKQLETLSGTVERVTFFNQENGWTILKVKPFNQKRNNELIPVILYSAKVFAGFTADFYGEWIQDKKHGEQFKCSHFIEKKPASINALEKYLGSGLIFGVGPATAKKITKYFQTETLTIFEKDIDRLIEVPGIAAAKLKMIKKSWTEHKSIRDIMLFLQNNDVSTLLAVKIYKCYGDNSQKILLENPYQIAKDIYGIGFFTADKIALNIGIDEKSPLRIKAAVRNILLSAKDDGHTFLYHGQISTKVDELLKMNIAKETLALYLNEMILDKEISTILSTEICYYSRTIFFEEKNSAIQVKEIAQDRIDCDITRVENWLARYTENEKVSLSDEQRQSILTIASSSVSILTGGPGCGKTTTIKTLVKLLTAMKKNIVLAAPTGRASQRMSQVCNLGAKTIHRLLKFKPGENQFTFNKNNPLSGDFFIFDECSMLDTSLFHSTISAIPKKAQILFVGDVNQLPSVGPGMILNDLINSNILPVCNLTKIFRQASNSKIITAAHQINRGELPELPSPIQYPKFFQEKRDFLFIESQVATQEQLKVIKRLKSLAKDNSEFIELEILDDALPEKFNYLTDVHLENLLKSKSKEEELTSILKKIPKYSTLMYNISAVDMIKKLYFESLPKYWGNLSEVQILSPMIRGVIGTQNINQEIQAEKYKDSPKFPLIVGQKKFYVGDRVIQTRNNYDLDVFNGEIGVIEFMDFENFFIDIKFDDKLVRYQKEDLSELELSYAISIHKSQGSEFDLVIIPLFTSHFKMLFRSLIYTGITRAKKGIILIGQKSAFRLAINNVQTLERQTNFKKFLTGEIL